MGLSSQHCLPALLQLLHDHQLQPDTIVMEAPVHLDAADTPGLGRHLHDGLGGRVSIISTRREPAPMPAQLEVMQKDLSTPGAVCARRVIQPSINASRCDVTGQFRRR